jgi:hypothetical protein
MHAVPLAQPLIRDDRNARHPRAGGQRGGRGLQRARERADVRAGRRGAGDGGERGAGGGGLAASEEGEGRVGVGGVAVGARPGGAGAGRRRDGGGVAVVRPLAVPDEVDDFRARVVERGPRYRCVARMLDAGYLEGHCGGRTRPAVATRARCGLGVRLTARQRHADAMYFP